jgi:hypothetical protein
MASIKSEEMGTSVDAESKELRVANFVVLIKGGVLVSLISTRANADRTVTRLTHYTSKVYSSTKRHMTGAIGLV